MITKKHMLIVSLLVCTLALIALGAGQKAVERPFKISGNVTVTIDGRTCIGTDFFCDATSEDWGEATHVGRFSNSAENLLVDKRNSFVTGSGILTAANGDQLFWYREDHYFTFTGGTGRFEGATGWFEITHPQAVSEIIPPYLYAKHPYEGTGEITY